MRGLIWPLGVKKKIKLEIIEGGNWSRVVAGRVISAMGTGAEDVTGSVLWHF